MNSLIFHEKDGYASLHPQKQGEGRLGVVFRPTRKNLPSKNKNEEDAPRVFRSSPVTSSSSSSFLLATSALRLLAKVLKEEKIERKNCSGKEVDQIGMSLVEVFTKPVPL
jgi:hypothetical protein